jgi:hypothetical protein
MALLNRVFLQAAGNAKKSFKIKALSAIPQGYGWGNLTSE